MDTGILLGGLGIGATIMMGLWAVPRIGKMLKINQNTGNHVNQQQLTAGDQSTIVGRDSIEKK